MAKIMNKEQYREAGQSHVKHMRELLRDHGDNAKLELHADHMRALIALLSAASNK
jgi:hypothetical protein